MKQIFSTLKYIQIFYNFSHKATLTPCPRLLGSARFLREVISTPPRLLLGGARFLRPTPPLLGKVRLPREVTTTPPSLPRSTRIFEIDHFLESHTLPNRRKDRVGVSPHENIEIKRYSFLISFVNNFLINNE